jgi:hypothetical protein
MNNEHAGIITDHDIAEIPPEFLPFLKTTFGGRSITKFDGPPFPPFGSLHLEFIHSSK